MSLKKSKSIRVMKRRGIIFFICYYVSKQCSVIRKYGFKQCALSFLEKKIEKRLKRSHNKLHLLLKLYPEKFLNKSQYGTFQLAYTHFEKNYKNIIAISPLFFIKNLKKHIEWLESDVFKNQYGGVANLESLSKNIINTTIFSVKNDNKANNIVTPPPPPTLYQYK